MKKATNLQVIEEITYKTNSHTPNSIEWDRNAPLKQMTLTLLYGLKHGAKNDDTNTTKSWIGDWISCLEAAVTEHNTRQALIKTLKQWHKLQINDTSVKVDYMSRNNNITNFIDYVNLSFKYISHQTDRFTALHILYLVVLHTNPGKEANNIQKYYQIKNALHLFHKKAGLDNNNYKKVLFMGYHVFSQTYTLKWLNLINLTSGFMIGSLFETLTQYNVPCS